MSTRKAGSDANALPIQPVEQPILCNPYQEPAQHWVYDTDTGEASLQPERRAAGYWYKTEVTGTEQRSLFVEEQRDDLPLVNALREDVRRWRESGYRGAERVTRDLLNHWSRADLPRRPFFCQREAVETIIYLAEMRLSGRSSRTGFRQFQLTDDDLQRLLAGERPELPGGSENFFPTLIDRRETEALLPLIRMACKMATGSGKTVVMAMLIAWAFCNRGRNRTSTQFPDAVLVCCPNLTVKERLQVLRPDMPGNYYEEFDLVPVKYRPLLQHGKVLITNWHVMNTESEHKEGDGSYAVVNKGPETPDDFARRVLAELHGRMPIMVPNDEGHHCWRPAPVAEELVGEERKEAESKRKEATVWVEGLDRINNALRTAVSGSLDPDTRNDRQVSSPGRPSVQRGARSGDLRPAGDHAPTGQGILFCVDLSATPFHIKGSGYPEGRPFPWIVSDFGLVDAIESGITKIPRLPVLDTTGRPDPRYFKLWDAIRDGLQPGEKLPGRAGKPKPEVVYRESEDALLQIAGQWVERFGQIQDAKPGQEVVPPVLIVVCDNTDIAEVFYRNISGETEEEVVTEEDVEEAAADRGADAPTKARKKSKKPKRQTVYGEGRVFPEYFSNTPTSRHTIRIDTKLLAEAESEDPSKTKSQAAVELRQVVNTVGKRGQPGEHVRCVVSVAMLTEGWDANNVTQVLGLRAFGSQLLCEQVVGRGLRRMDYVPDPETGKLTEEYVDVYGIPFSVIPFKGRAVGGGGGEDKPNNHVRALPERKHMEMRFPVVEGYAFALRQNVVRCDVGAMEPLELQPNRVPTATYVLPQIGYKEGHAAKQPEPFGEYVVQDREQYYREHHLQTIKFEIARRVMEDLCTGNGNGGKTGAKARVMRLQSRHQLFPQVYRYVDEYVERKVDFRGEHKSELGLDVYVQRIVGRLRDAIEPDEAQGEPPLMPILNRYKPLGTTTEVDFKTVRPCVPTQRSHVNQVVGDNKSWEAAAAFRLDTCKAVTHYARNDHLGCRIPYELLGVEHTYEPDFLVRLTNGLTVVLEIKGYEEQDDRAKHEAARKWVRAVNNWGQLGQWAFHVCRDPQVLERELGALRGSGAGSG